MTIEERIELITRSTEEVLTKEDLASLLAKNIPLKHYIGFEISGKIHLGTGLVCMQKVKDFRDAGVACSIFLADWHTWINDKLGGDRETIKRVAVGYFKEGMSAAYDCLGGDPSELSFVLGSDLYDRNNRYWETVIDIAKNVTLSRTQRSITILGRKEGGDVDFAKLIYPVMQVADVFEQGIHIAHAGLDQRKAYVIMRDVAGQMKVAPLAVGGETVKPVAIHHHLLLGLQKPDVWPIPAEMDKQEVWASMKMSKSKPDGAIFIHDAPEEIARKVGKAFCPEREVGFNPIIDWAEWLIFPREREVVVKRSAEHGGDMRLGSVAELKERFASGALHPADLKAFVASYLADLLAPARERFSSGAPKEMLAELEALVASPK